MDRDEIERVRAELDEFVGEVFASLARKDQRAKGGLYLQGLMLEGRRKSMQPMGDRLGIDYQQLQQFVSSSPWPVEPVRRRLARKATALICPEAWVVDDTGFVKDGPASPGVARQYSGTLGKIGNVQIGVSIHAVTDAASCPQPAAPSRPSDQLSDVRRRLPTLRRADDNVVVVVLILLSPAADRS